MNGECCTNNNVYRYETKANSSQSIELGDVNHYVVVAQSHNSTSPDFLKSTLNLSNLCF